MSSIAALDFTNVKVCGRKEELTQLTNAYKRASEKWNASREVVLIEGISGTGKTALVDMFRESIGTNDFLFCQAKFDEDIDVSEPFAAMVLRMRLLPLTRKTKELDHEKLVTVILGPLSASYNSYSYRYADTDLYIFNSDGEHVFDCSVEQTDHSV
jgi:hypothetical protein